MSFFCSNRCRLSKSNVFFFNKTIATEICTLSFPHSLRKYSGAGIWCGAARCTDGDGGCAAVTCNRCMSFCCSNRDRKSVVKGKSVDLGGGRIIKKNYCSH